MLTAKKVILRRHRDAITSTLSPRGTLAITLPRLISAIVTEEARIISKKLSSTSCSPTRGIFTCQSITRLTYIRFSLASRKLSTMLMVPDFSSKASCRLQEHSVISLTSLAKTCFAWILVPLHTITLLSEDALSRNYYRLRKKWTAPVCALRACNLGSWMSVCLCGFHTLMVMSAEPVKTLPLCAVRAVMGARWDFSGTTDPSEQTHRSSLLAKNKTIVLPTISTPARPSSGSRHYFSLDLDLRENCWRMTGASLVVTKRDYWTKKAWCRCYMGMAYASAGGWQKCLGVSLSCIFKSNYYN